MSNVSSMIPHCAALRDYYNGCQKEPLRIIRSDGHSEVIPVEFFFSEDFSKEDRSVLDLCVGRILDIGAGAGRHSLYLQDKGYDVHAIEVCPELAFDVLPKRGIRSIECADIFSYSSEHEFDTLLLLGHGLGLSGSLLGLRTLLDRCENLLSLNGIIIADSLDVTKTDNQVHTHYQNSLVNMGRYRGEMRFHLEYEDLVGTEFGWLHVDVETLSSVADNWNVELIWEDMTGNYWSKITRATK